MKLGRYRIEALVGEGANGRVFRARDEEMDRLVALKLVRPDRLDPETLERFRREARAAARVNDSRVVAIHEMLDVPGGEVALVLEWVPGGTLSGRLANAGRLSWREAARLAADIASGLAALHRAGLVHRDVKPSNVLLDADGRAKVAGSRPFEGDGVELVKQHEAARAAHRRPPADAPRPRGLPRGVPLPRPRGPLARDRDRVGPRPHPRPRCEDARARRGVPDVRRLLRAGREDPLRDHGRGRGARDRLALARLDVADGPRPRRRAPRRDLRGRAGAPLRDPLGAARPDGPPRRDERGRALALPGGEQRRREALGRPRAEALLPLAP